MVKMLQSEEAHVDNEINLNENNQENQDKQDETKEMGDGLVNSQVQSDKLNTESKADNNGYELKFDEDEKKVEPKEPIIVD